MAIWPYLTERDTKDLYGVGQGNRPGTRRKSMQLNINLDLDNERVRRQLLAGLDSWVRLGLLSESQVSEIAAVLSKPLPPVSAESARAETIGARQINDEIRTQAAITSATGTPESSKFKGSFVSGSFTQPAQEESEPVAQKVSWVSQAVASLVEEISVIWLLFLGVFLVIVSSGVLAASQWDSFSAIGQYGILFAYTLAFWAASLWAQKQENLQSTGRMLALTTMLLIPVNFWVMDRFGVLSTSLGIGVAFVAAIALTALPLGLSNELMPRRTNRLNLIGLSWLHWGWSWAIPTLFGTAIGWPVIATYLGTIGTAANLTAQDRQQIATDTASVETTEEPEELSEEQPEEPIEEQPDQTGLSFDVLTVALSVLILLIRSLWVAQVPPSQLGLAAGICGWLLVWLTRHKTSRLIWERAGFGLLLIGWIVSVAQSPPLQAIAISLLAISLLWLRLQQTWHKTYLFAGLGVGLQAYSLVWSVVPSTFRDRLLTWLSTWFNVGVVQKINWAGIGLFPYLLGMLAFAVYLRRHPQTTLTHATQNAHSDYPEPSLSQITEQLALALGFGLALISVGNPFTSAVNLSLSTLTLFIVLWKRQLQPKSLVSLGHGIGFLTIVSWIYYIAPGLSITNWARILLGGAIAEFIAHLILHQPSTHQPPEHQPSQKNIHLQLNTWYAGLGLSTLSYGLLLDTQDQHPNWLWLTIPIILTLIANSRRTPHPKAAAGITMGALALQLPWLETWPIAILSFAVATLCMGLNSRIWRSHYTTFFTVGTALLLTGSAVWYSLLQHLNNSGSRILIFWVIAVWSLWLIQRGLKRRTNRTSGEMALKYARATQIWAAILMVSYLSWATVIALANTFESSLGGIDTSYTNYTFAATIILIAALAESIRYRPMEWRYWSLAWAAEIALVTSFSLQSPIKEGGFVNMGIATLALAFAVELAADWWIKLKQSPYRDSWHYIPLVLTVIGLFLGHAEPQANAGFFTIATGLLLIGIGRRNRPVNPQFQLFSYAGLAAISIGAYELLTYQLLQASGGSAGDGRTILAALAIILTLLYRIFRSPIATTLKISTHAVGLIGYAHWALGCLLCVISPLEGLSQPQGIAIWTICSLLLSAYALVSGNQRWNPETIVFNHTLWTWIGLVGTLMCIAYDRDVWFPDRTTLFTWGGVIACTIGTLLYYAPWEKFGWTEPDTAEPFKITGLWLPILTLSITTQFATTQSLLLLATFYAWMAKQSNRIRLSYLSIALLDFALLDYLDLRDWLTPTTLSLIIGLSILYFAEIEPALKDNDRRQQKHWVRILASSIVGLSALYQTEISDPLLLFAAIALILATLFIFAGLILKVRAFLYVGTATFIAQILRILWLFISANSLLLWAVGIVLGLLFIWVAATFESRRSQLSARLSSWTSALESWE